MLWLRIWVVEWYGVVWNSRRSVLIINRWHSSKQILTMFLSRQKSQSTEGRRGGLLAPPPRYTWDGMGTMAPPIYASTRVWGPPWPCHQVPRQTGRFKKCFDSIVTRRWMWRKTWLWYVQCPKTNFSGISSCVPVFVALFLMLATCNWICSVAPLLFGDSQ